MSAEKSRKTRGLRKSTEAILPTDLCFCCFLLNQWHPWKTPSSKLIMEEGSISFWMLWDRFISDHIRSSHQLFCFYFYFCFSIQVASCRILNCFSSNPFTADRFHYQPALLLPRFSTFLLLNGNSLSIIIPAVTMSSSTQEIAFAGAIHQDWTHGPLYQQKHAWENVFQSLLIHHKML